MRMQRWQIELTKWFYCFSFYTRSVNYRSYEYRSAGCPMKHVIAFLMSVVYDAINYGMSTCVFYE